MLLAYSRCFPRFCGLLHAPGRILGAQTFRAAGGFPHFTYTHFSGCRHRRSLPTQTFRVVVSVAVCILGTQTFRVAGVLHFTLASPVGGDVEEIGNFQEWNIRSHGTSLEGKTGN